MEERNLSRDRASNDAIPCRVMFALLMFSMLVCTSMQGTSIEVTLMRMVKHHNNTFRHYHFCAKCKPTYNSSLQSLKFSSLFGPKYDWDHALQLTILSSYWWGYCCTQVVGGFLADIYGTRNLIIYTQGFAAILSSLVPLATGVHYKLLIFIRFCIGLMEGVVYPAMHAAIARWAPPHEKAKFIWAATGGIYGDFLIFPFLDLISEALGWQVSLYCLSLVMIIMVILWILLMHDNPSQHPGISKTEQDYIKGSIGNLVIDIKQITGVPWKKILTSSYVIVLMLLHFSFMWGLRLQYSYGLNYVSEVLGSQQKSVCVWLYLLPLIFGFVFSVFGDYIMKENLVTMTYFRKIVTIVSHVLPGTLLTLVALLHFRPGFIVFLFMFSLTISGAGTAGSLLNHHDLAPNFAGTIYGTMNTLGTMSGFLSYVMVDSIIIEKNGFHRWQIIWGTAAIFYFITAILYFWKGSGKLQKWNNILENKCVPKISKKQEITPENL